MHFELHGYQIDFLGKMAKSQGLGSEGAALQSIVDRAMSTGAPTRPSRSSLRRFRRPRR